jgi:hypothetical protein
MKSQRRIATILLGALLIMSAFYIPVQAGAAFKDERSSNLNFAPSKTRSVRPTKKPRSTAIPMRTATRPPVNTATRFTQTAQPGTSAVLKTGTPGTLISTSGTPQSTSLFSPTPTALSIQTVSARMSETVAASYLTSTAIAQLYSPTPTKFGAPTGTPTTTPNASEVAETFVALTANPEAANTSIAIFPTNTPTPSLVLVNQTTEAAPPTNWTVYLFAGFGAIILLALLYVLYQEWAKGKAKSGSQK